MNQYWVEFENCLPVEIQVMFKTDISPTVMVLDYLFNTHLHVR